MLKLVGGLGISVIDLDPVFQAHGDPLSLFPFARPATIRSGATLVAEEVIRNLHSIGRTGSAGRATSMSVVARRSLSEPPR